MSSDLYFEEIQHYWEKDENGAYYHPPNRMPKSLAYRRMKAFSPRPGVSVIWLITRMKHSQTFERTEFILPEEAWMCCMQKWTGKTLGSLINYIMDYVAHPGKMESEMFEYDYEDWKAKMESDSERAEKISEGRRRYKASLNTFETYRFKYTLLWHYDKDDLKFDVDDDVMCYACYHRATPTYIHSIMGLVPMWCQMESMIKRWQ